MELEHKSLADYLNEQRNLYKIYTSDRDRELITLFADKIRGLMESEEREWHE